MLETQAVTTAQPADGAADLITTARQSGRSVTIVSNNSGQAVAAYLADHGLARYVSAVIGRDDPNPAHMKPNPYRVRQAVQMLQAAPAECVLVGDLVSDVTAAHAADVAAIGYANKPGKDERLAQAGADTVIRAWPTSSGNHRRGGQGLSQVPGIHWRGAYLDVAEWLRAGASAARPVLAVSNACVDGVFMSMPDDCRG